MLWTVMYVNHFLWVVSTVYYRRYCIYYCKNEVSDHGGDHQRLQLQFICSLYSEDYECVTSRHLSECVLKTRGQERNIWAELMFFQGFGDFWIDAMKWLLLMWRTWICFSASGIECGGFSIQSCMCVTKQQNTECIFTSLDGIFCNLRIFKQLNFAPSLRLISCCFWKMSY